MRQGHTHSIRGARAVTRGPRASGQGPGLAWQVEDYPMPPAVAATGIRIKHRHRKSLRRLRGRRPVQLRRGVLTVATGSVVDLFQPENAAFGQNRTGHAETGTGASGVHRAG